MMGCQVDNLSMEETLATVERFTLFEALIARAADRGWQGDQEELALVE